MTRVTSGVMAFSYGMLLLKFPRLGTVGEAWEVRMDEATESMNCCPWWLLTPSHMLLGTQGALGVGKGP